MNRRNVSGSDASGLSKTSLRTSLAIHSSLKSTIFAFSAEVSYSISHTFKLYRKLVPDCPNLVFRLKLDPCGQLPHHVRKFQALVLFAT